MNTQPLSIPFNYAVLTCAARCLPRGFDVSEDAPSTFKGLLRHFLKTRRVLVWSGSSDQTIYADPSVNHTFRAWHDSKHLTRAIPFTLEGEREVCELQKDDIRALYGQDETADYFCSILEAEIVGQRLYEDKHGYFPANQMAFVKAYLDDPQTAIERRLYN